MGASQRYGEGYLERRLAEVDYTELYDIYWALRALGVPRGSRIVDLGAGTGLLVRFLRARGYDAVGVDLLYSDELVSRADLAIEDPPPARAYTAQHFLEHIPQGRAMELIAIALRRGACFVAVLPGHYSSDPTHVVNHYELPDARGLAEEALRLAGRGYYRVEPDTWSHVDPASRDWILAVSPRPVPPLKPYWIRIPLGAYRRLMWLLARRARGVAMHWS